jgi:hypothetical protein
MCQDAIYNIKTRVVPFSADANLNATLPDGPIGGSFWPTILIVIISSGKRLFCVEICRLYRPLDRAWQFTCTRAHTRTDMWL